MKNLKLMAVLIVGGLLVGGTQAQASTITNSSVIQDHNKAQGTCIAYEEVVEETVTEETVTEEIVEETITEETVTEEIVEEEYIEED